MKKIMISVAPVAATDILINPRALPGMCMSATKTARPWCTCTAAT